MWGPEADALTVTWSFSTLTNILGHFTSLELGSFCVAAGNMVIITIGYKGHLKPPGQKLISPRFKLGPADIYSAYVPLSYLVWDSSPRPADLHIELSYLFRGNDSIGDWHLWQNHICGFHLNLGWNRCQKGSFRVKSASARQGYFRVCSY